MTIPYPQPLLQALQPLVSDPHAILDVVLAEEHQGVLTAFLTQRQQASWTYYTFTIPNFHPMALNTFRGAGQHGRFIEQAGKREMIGLLHAYGHGVPRITESYRPFRKVHMTVLYGKGLRRHDKDAFDKVAKDALKRAHLIVDDSLQWLAWSVDLVLDKTIAPKQHATKIELWEGMSHGTP